MALSSIWAMGRRDAARPSSLPSPRRGRCRGCTSCGRSGRPGMRIGSGGGASAGRTMSPRAKAAAYSWVNATLRAGSASSRQARAAWYRSITTRLPSAGATAVLGLVRAQLLQALEVTRLDPGHVIAVEARRIEAGELRVALAHRRLEVLEVLVDQPVAAQQLLDLLDAAVVRDQLVRRRHVDAVDVRMAHRRRGAGQVDLARAGVARHLHDLLAGGAAHDRVVHQQDHAVAELQVDRVELAAHRLNPLALARHDEGAADVAVLDEALAVLHAQHVGDLQSRVARGVRDRDD